MSGGIFSPLENLCDLDNANCHPLVCLLCQEQYEHPCLLDCYHNFCASCLRGRSIDSRLTCPLCGHQSIVKGNGLPPEDRLLKFLVDSSGDCEEVVQCANCDLQSTKQVEGIMAWIYYTRARKAPPPPSRCRCSHPEASNRESKRRPITKEEEKGGSHWSVEGLDGLKLLFRKKPDASAHQDLPERVVK